MRQKIFEYTVIAVDGDNVGTRNIAELQKVLQKIEGETRPKALGRSNSTSNRSSRGNMSI